MLLIQGWFKLSTERFKFLPALLIKQYFWYLELCLPTAVAVFYTLFATFTVMNRLVIIEMMKKKTKQKLRMLYIFEEMQVHAHLNLYGCVLHSEYIWSLNDIGVYMYEYG